MDNTLAKFIEANKGQIKDALSKILDSIETAYEISQTLYEMGYQDDAIMVDVMMAAAADDADLMERVDRVQKIMDDELLQSQQN